MTRIGAVVWPMALSLLLVVAGACTEATPPPPRMSADGPMAGTGGALDANNANPGAPVQDVQNGGNAGLPGDMPGPDAVGPAPDADTGTPIPCDVAQVVAESCQTCHGARPIGGAIRLVTHEDWHEVSPVYAAAKLGDPTKLVHEVAQIRINNGEMPQGAPMAPEALATLDAWLRSGALAGGADDASCAGATVPADLKPVDGDGDGGGGRPDLGQLENDCGGANAYDPLVPLPGETTCYEFPVHGLSTPTDKSKFTVAPGESYHEFIYDVPWEPGAIATRFGADFDNIQVLHHWLAFGYNTAQAHGTVNQNVTGTTLGAGAELIAGWAVGGCNFVLPDDMGLELPPSGHLMVQWHMYNSTGIPQQDGTKVQICTASPTGRPNIGGLTWLGTENFNGPLGMPPGMNEFGGTCINDSTGPITIIGFLPHLHTIGINMRSDIQRAGSQTWEPVFDQPFQFDYQVHYMMEPALVLQPNDKIRSICTFFNDTGANVAFGQSTNQEMCYQFAFSYPAGALDNGVLSLIGATNTCWQFGE